MKKILLLFPLILIGCNYQVVDLNFKYQKVYFYETDKCYEISSWKDYEDGEQVQVDVKGYGKILTSTNNCFLVVDKCPICD